MGVPGNSEQQEDWNIKQCATYLSDME